MKITFLVAQSKGKTPRQLSRLPKVKSLQEMTLAELEKIGSIILMLTRYIGILWFWWFEALEVQQLGAKPGQKITEDIQTYAFLKITKQYYKIVKMLLFGP